ncbi:polymerase [Kosakonia phage Kc263]|uniref:Uncharacterized protein n=1 Tax=Kosakonia phage Kc263 TaxID=2863194 RepID=A0AAE7WHZ4_9CAUD|nr:polymerase [Kosakonia phage Kc263]QYN79969.1 hypothetical protein [Kosakonia phage Kc263]
MDPQILKAVQQDRGPFTQELVDGWHKKDMDRIVPHLEKCFGNMFRSLQEKGYIFDGIEEVCPLEFYNLITRSSSSGTKDFEIAKNSFFGIRILNHFKDPVTGVESELKNPLMYLAYTNKHGDIWTRNSTYSLQYVLSERGPSVDGARDKAIFIRVLGYKFKVTKEIHTFNRVFRNGDKVGTGAINMTLPANRFMNSRNDRKITSKKVPIPLLGWYVFGKYGFSQCMQEFAECDYQIDTLDTLLDICPESEGWQIYSNTGQIHPKAFDRPKGTPLLDEPAIAIKSRNKGSEISNLALQYTGALLFMFGVFSHELDIRRLDDIDYWRLIIGRCSIRLPTKTPPSVYLRQMNEHFSSIEELADDITVEKYNKFDIDIRSTYDLFNYLMLNYSSLIKLYDPADMLHKELASMEFLVDHLIHQANEFRFMIRNKSNITPKIINRELDAHFRLFNIDRSVLSNNTILEQTGTDNPFIDYGLGIIMQTKSTVNRGPGKKKEEFDPNHPGSVIHASQPFVVSYQYATKPNPDSRGMLQPRVYLVQGKYTGLRPEDRGVYEDTKRRLKFRES